MEVLNLVRLFWVWDYISLTYSFSDIVPSSGALVFVSDFLVKTTGWWFQTFIIFTRKIGDDDPNLTCAYFSKGLVQPPTTP